MQAFTIITNSMSYQPHLVSASNSVLAVIEQLFIMDSFLLSVHLGLSVAILESSKPNSKGHDISSDFCYIQAQVISKTHGSLILLVCFHLSFSMIFDLSITWRCLLMSL